ncbi:unnamed protein product [Linum trigynum]|uniref:Uncharacterized protein n=1 Tax=Linum trigynum TaxID=586398 RepID=A0AAV2G8Q6_9ROSI
MQRRAAAGDCGCGGSAGDERWRPLEDGRKLAISLLAITHHRTVPHNGGLLSVFGDGGSTTVSAVAVEVAACLLDGGD